MLKSERRGGTGSRSETGGWVIWLKLWREWGADLSSQCSSVDTVVTLSAASSEVHVNSSCSVTFCSETTGHLPKTYLVVF